MSPHSYLSFLVRIRGWVPLISNIQMSAYFCYKYSMSFLDNLKQANIRVAKIRAKEQEIKDQLYIDTRDKQAMKLARERLIEINDKSLSTEQQSIRLEICKSCNSLLENKCTECNCPINIITSFAPFICPLHKWGSEV